MKHFHYYQKLMWITYQQPVIIVKKQLYMLWRTSDSIQDVDKKCGNVDNFCGYVVCKLFVIMMKRVVNCEYLDSNGWQIKREVFKAGD